MRRDADDPGMAWGLLLVLGAVAGAAMLLAARTGRTGGGWPPRALIFWRRGPAVTPRVQLLETRPLGATCTLYLVRWDDEEVLLACAAKGVSVVSRRIAEPSPPGAS